MDVLSHYSFAYQSVHPQRAHLVVGVDWGLDLHRQQTTFSLPSPEFYIYVLMELGPVRLLLSLSS
jgi:hypothetical protein